MGEETDSYRLKMAEREITDIKCDSKAMRDSITAMRESNIRIEIDVKKILDTYTLIRNSVILILVANVVGILWAIK